MSSNLSHVDPKLEGSRDNPELGIFKNWRFLALAFLLWQYSKLSNIFKHVARWVVAILLLLFFVAKGCNMIIYETRGILCQIGCTKHCSYQESSPSVSASPETEGSCKMLELDPQDNDTEGSD